MLWPTSSGSCWCAAVCLLLCLLSSMVLVEGQKPPPSPEQGPQYLNMVTFKQGSGLPSGNLLVADALSLYSKGKKLNGATCKQLAMRLQGANGWAFCGAKGGCGSGCAAYTKANPPLPINKSPVGKAYWARSLPVKGVGYWTYPKPGLKGCALDAKGKATDMWAFGTCRILKVADVKKPNLQSKAAGAGWQYGTIIRDKKCARLLSSTCAACMTSTNPFSCLACSSGFIVQPANALQAMLAPNLEGQSAQQAACVRCAAMPYGPTTARCIQCVARKKPCNQCAITTWSPEQKAPKFPDLPSCINCAWDSNLLKVDAKPYTTTFSTTRATVCRQCALRPPAKRNQCGPCMATFADAMCPSNDPDEGPYQAYQAKFGPCQPPKAILAECDEAFKSYGKKFTQCVKKGRAKGCISCLPFKGAVDSCMNCVLTRNKDCTTCMYNSYAVEDWVSLPSCENCLVDKTVKGPRSYCRTCNGVGVDDLPDYHINYSVCNACIRNPKTTDFKTCEVYVTS